MVNLTIRNIPGELMKKLRKQSTFQRRSINSEVLTLLEKSLLDYSPKTGLDQATVDAQAEIWQVLSSQWDDSRSASEIAAEIFSARTKGREVEI